MYKKPYVKYLEYQNRILLLLFTLAQFIVCFIVWLLKAGLSPGILCIQDVLQEFYL